MSAWVVDKAHINAMIDAGLRVKYPPMTWHHNDKPHELTAGNASEVGQMLLDECVKSVSYRYEDSKVTELLGRTDAEYLLPFEYRRFANPPSPVEILKQIDCYEYQSCEHPEWESSESHSFCQALRHCTIDRLPGYDEAPWGWEKWPTETMQRII